MTDTSRLLARLKARSADLPRHIAIIMDGSGRWARRRGLPRLAGHRAGRASVRAAVEGCIALGVETLTLYTFSVENWNRPRAEVGGLMRFLQRTLREERAELRENGVRLRIIGQLDALPEEARAAAEETVRFLEGGQRLELVLAISYGGRQELVHAARALAEQVRAGRLQPGDIDEQRLAAELWTGGLPDPDLLIRTSGEMRVSNFLLWQIAYAEIWVTPVLWPDFRARHLYEAVASYLERERRFGRVAARPPFRH
ncbi:MAG TPA: polyprenyl diphosphate synthase [Candidatus Saccharimonadales bacterium]|nr:polyprenyl diphosphate synthase [Candidatus Saccharimonadales bacterium]